MRHLFLIILCTFLGNSSIAQRGAYAAMDEPPTYGEYLAMEFTYGTHMYWNNFGDQFNTFENYTGGAPVQTVGITVSSFFYNSNKKRIGFHYSYDQIIPQDVNINDTLNARINGFNYGMSLASFDLISSSKVCSLPIGIGFNTGRLRMVSENRRSQKNPYFAPAVFFTPRFFIGNFVIGLRASYHFDISRKTWRSVNVNSDQTPFALDEFRQTGLIANFCIGFKFF